MSPAGKVRLSAFMVGLWLIALVQDVADMAADEARDACLLVGISDQAELHPHQHAEAGE